MNSKAIVAIFAGLSLVLPIMSFDAFAGHEQFKRGMATSISLDQIEQCANTMQCNAKIFTGETVQFSGMLTDSDGNPLADKEVSITALLPAPALVVLATAMTDDEGMFATEWTAQLLKEITAFQDVTKQVRSESLEIFAAFAGDEEMEPSKSNKLSVTVTVNSINTSVNSDKTLYSEGDSVLIFVAFIDSNDEFIDPDSIRATWNNEPIELEQKKTGSYTFTIENLTKRHQQIIIVPHTEGFNASTAFLTIIVDGLR